VPRVVRLKARACEYRRALRIQSVELNPGDFPMGIVKLPRRGRQGRWARAQVDCPVGCRPGIRLCRYDGAAAAFDVCLTQTSSSLVRLTLRAICLTIMPTVIALLLHTILAALKTRHQLAMENLALRHQIQVLQRSGKRPPLTRADRILWVLLSRIWHDWRDGLVLVKPDTVVRWHRKGFKLYWRRKGRKRKRGRPRVRRPAVMCCRPSPPSIRMEFSRSPAGQMTASLLIPSRRGATHGAPHP